MKLEIGQIYKVTNNIMFYTPDTFSPQLIRENSVITILDKNTSKQYKILTSIVLIEQKQGTYTPPTEIIYCGWLHEVLLDKGLLKPLK